MRIVVAAQALTGVGGSETYAITAADHLQRLGHEVWLRACDLGDAADRARALGLDVDVLDVLPEAPDAILAQDGIAAVELAGRLPRVPQVLVAHSDVFDHQLPPQVAGVVTAVVALYDRVDRRVRALSVAPEVVRLTQPVDVGRFRPLRALPARPAVALALGNYLHGERLSMVARACDHAGVQLRQVGRHGQAERRPLELELNDADVVFGKARVIHEAMACGRAAYVLDHNGGDGWVTAQTYSALVADNFGGQSTDAVIDEDRLVADLAAYDPAMGLANRDLMVRHHAATAHAAALVDVLRRAAATAATAPTLPDGPYRELARAMRLAHRADMLLSYHQAETERLHRLVVLEQDSGMDAVRQRDDALARAAAAEEALRALAATRRWRALQRVLGPPDRLRARMRRP